MLEGVITMLDLVTKLRAKAKFTMFATVAAWRTNPSESQSATRYIQALQRLRGQLLLYEAHPAVRHSRAQTTSKGITPLISP